MVNDLVRDRGEANKILKQQGVPALLDAYDLTPEQKAAFKNPGWASFGEIGLHPIHTLLLSMRLNPNIEEHFSWKGYMTRYEDEVLHASNTTKD